VKHLATFETAGMTIAVELSISAHVPMALHFPLLILFTSLLSRGNIKILVNFLEEV
jgi:hypothetical protein